MLYALNFDKMYLWRTCKRLGPVCVIIIIIIWPKEFSYKNYVTPILWNTFPKDTGFLHSAFFFTCSRVLHIGSGSLSSPMREHRNVAQFYCISVTNFSTVSECILLEIIWIKRTFSSYSYGCCYVCMQCTSKNCQLIFYGRYLPFVRCRSRSPRLERKQSMCLSVRWQSDTRCTQQYVVSLDQKLNADSSGVNAVVIYKHLWSLERILVGNSQKNSILNRKTPSNVYNIPHQNEAESVPFRMRYGANGLMTCGSFTSQ